SLSGGNTGDACSLYDTDNDGNINLAVCVTWGGTAQLQAVRLFACTSDDRPENCDGSVLLNYCSNDSSKPCLTNSECGAGTCQLHNTSGSVIGTPGTTCTLAQSTDDPFATDSPYPQDTQATCSVDLNDFGAPSARLIDVCSYPSTSTPSNASDCILTTVCSTD